jgi:hypothetical protein
MMVSTYPTSTPATTGVFISSITPKAPKMLSDTWHHRSPPPSILSRFSAPKTTQIFPPTAKPVISLLKPYDTNIPSTQLPNTSHSVAITDTVGSSKSHRNLLPVIRDLI